MNGYQKLKTENERLKHSEQHAMNRATAYFFAIASYIPEDKKKDAAEMIEIMLKEHKENREYAHLDPAVAFLRENK